MEILAFGVRRDERPLLEAAFAGRHDIRSLDIPLIAGTVALATGYEAVSTTAGADLGAAVLEALAKGGTRMIAQRSAEFGNIDTGHAERLGLTVARVPAVPPYAVAEFAWTLATAVNRRVVRAVNRTREGDFRLDGLLGRDFHGRTAGVVGTGPTGAAFARIAYGFGMGLLGWDSEGEENPECLRLGMEYADLDRLFREADLISLHVPLLPGTHHLVDAAALAAMKDDAILVNAGGGGLIDTAAMAETVRQRRLDGVGLDIQPVHEGEAGADGALERLMMYPEVLVTPGQAYYTCDALQQIIKATVKNIDDYVAGRTTEATLVAKPN
ncbi:NAD(P)-dependent oxidoreductase [Actinacidiphila oryziradicis]|uniref:NAD(P)-dependent oxidoreductase n=1 Tax=Actinacidiphila oryziradicis TaxID=2571141 RepID=UPI0023F2C0AB|nr:NAD(P)-dependent oxidoreductase [Actinacidiphila oryziradicis]MCW2874927.1 D-isomer specific 2-hydroxyacid dehydrogenase NAD-binding protein [Actinacidiphila oryziradicis]